MGECYNKGFDLRKLQEFELDILKEVDRICRKHNIEYFLSWGSALGAVRHKGFIPWDDDIDICMLWPEYEKFLEVSKVELADKYFLQNDKTDKYCWIAWSKVRMNNTTSRERWLRHMKSHYGICIDIFPLVSIPDVDSLRNKQKKYVDIYCKLCWNRIEKYTKESKKGFLYRRIPNFIIKAIKKYLLKEIVKYDIDDCNYVGDVFSGYDEKTIYKKQMFLDGEKVIFENFETRIPNECDQYLKQCYGDYMKLPNEEDRVVHGNLIVDFEKSYEYYTID